MRPQKGLASTSVCSGNSEWWVLFQIDFYLDGLAFCSPASMVALLQSDTNMQTVCNRSEQMFSYVFSAEPQVRREEFPAAFLHIFTTDTTDNQRPNKISRSLSPKNLKSAHQQLMMLTLNAVPLIIHVVWRVGCKLGAARDMLMEEVARLQEFTVTHTDLLCAGVSIFVTICVFCCLELHCEHHE